MLLKKIYGESSRATRGCDDLKGLNEQCVVKQYNVPNEKLVNVKARNSKYFTTLDNAKGFYKRALAEESRKFFAFTMPDGRRV
ncbi:hypothetical protein Zmor_022093 [Zophobas morio]|jgi:hypothetical protein|uniref:Uncharacterized protein n=1 Tax=Zophobas morio TaxID=2755281 RepID=A0AA38HL56_9CUCU|nr:hypothetical protein Zmor_022093 [Zophobas morio]